MDFYSTLVNSTLRLTLLDEGKPVLEARVERVEEDRIAVTCDRPLKIRAAIQLETSDRMLLGEVFSFDRTPDGYGVLLDIQHSLLRADVEQIRARLSAPVIPGSRAWAAGA